MKEKVLIGMSGGVDSSVAALLLLRQGYDVMGVTMDLRPELPGQSGCGSAADAADAKRVAGKLGIEHRVLDLKERFRQDVIDYFAGEYAAGRTPNPCIACNRSLKFGAMLEAAKELGCQYIATGHYAHVAKEGGRWLLYRAPGGKDQSYVLYTLTQEQLSSTLFPLCGYTKPQIREMAAQAELPVANKPDSQEICFIPDKDYGAFLRKYTGKTPQPGEFVDSEGNVLGKHRGIPYYTIGQRKGLGVSFGKPMYVTKIEPAGNRVWLGPEGSQYRDSLLAGALNWIAFENPEQPFSAQAKIRYQAEPADAEVIPQQDGNARVVFREPQRSVTPGQAVVFYRGDLVLGGGVIME